MGVFLVEAGQPYWSWYGFGGRVEWCACFASWCADQCGYHSSAVCRHPQSCPPRCRPSHSRISLRFPHGRLSRRSPNQRKSSGCSFALHIPCAVPAMIVSSASSKVSRSTSNRRRKVVFPVGVSGCMYWSTDMWNIVTS